MGLEKELLNANKLLKALHTIPDKAADDFSPAAGGGAHLISLV